MKINKYILLSLISIVILFSACSSKKGIPAAFYNCSVECLGTGVDGTQLVKAWGIGADMNEAIEKAKLNAIRTVLFNGITAGKAGCMIVPLINVPGTEQLHQDFFNKFFSADGKYVNFIVLSVTGFFWASICCASEASAAALSTPFAQTHARTSACVRLA